MLSLGRTQKRHHQRLKRDTFLSFIGRNTFTAFLTTKSGKLPVLEWSDLSEHWFSS